jgi:hypothetical protein
MIITQKKMLSQIQNVSLNSNDKSDTIHTKIHINFLLVRSTSWQSAKLMQSILYMDINLVQKISDIYNVQEYYETIIKKYVMDNLYGNNNRVDNESSEELMQFLNAIIPIEENLVEAYTHILNEL